jgi:acetyl/propionyl-CoA carboxylase alpha subunit
MKKKIRKVLIANRGEVALRVIRAAKELGLEIVIAYERPDRDAYYIRFAEEAVLIGNGPVKDYLDIDRMIWAARKSGADAVHPGYGFLAEDPDFAEACERAGIIFIGPPSGILRSTANKAYTRGLMMKANIPIIPGTQVLSPGERGLAEALAFGRRSGYPVMVKAVKSGGGRGVRCFADEESMVRYLNRIRSKPRKLWSEGIFLEKCIEAVKHVEIQILADRYGNVIHLGSRDGSIQRHYQKLLEIAPANIAPEVLDSLYTAAVRAVKEIGYSNAGTVEFLVDPATGEFWFLAMNRRLQVEHTVTEELVNIDIVREQFGIAAGNRLTIPQHRIQPLGKAVQVRINAEDPLHNFRPEGGKSVELYLPPGGPGIRLDGILYHGYRIPSEYDSLLIKMTVKGYDWEQTSMRLERALDSFLLVGPQTTIPFYRAICDEPDFRCEEIDTNYVRNHPQIFNYPDPGLESVKLEKSFLESHIAEFLPDSWL